MSGIKNLSKQLSYNKLKLRLNNLFDIIIWIIKIHSNEILIQSDTSPTPKGCWFIKVICKKLCVLCHWFTIAVTKLRAACYFKNAKNL